MDEDHPCRPINAYGESKLIFEKILDWYHASYGFQFNAFRYFNAAGATQRLGEAHKHESHLIPCLIQVAMGLQGKGSPFSGPIIRHRTEPAFVIISTWVTSHRLIFWPSITSTRDSRPDTISAMASVLPILKS